MKLKQRLLLIPTLFFLYLVLKPLWNDESDHQPWRNRERYVGPVVRRKIDGRKNQPVGAPYHGLTKRQSDKEHGKQAAKESDLTVVKNDHQYNQDELVDDENIEPRPYPVKHVDLNLLPQPVEVTTGKPVILPVSSDSVLEQGDLPIEKTMEENLDFDDNHIEKPMENGAEEAMLNVNKNVFDLFKQKNSDFLYSDGEPLLPKAKTPEPKSTKAPRNPLAIKSTNKRSSLAGGGQLKFVTMKAPARAKFLEDEIHNIGIDLNMKTNNDPWQTAKDWVRSRSIYPQKHQALGSILKALSTTKVMKADILTKGTQLKMLWFLQGNQKVIFKPKRYERDVVIQGKAYDGYDRHNGEIAAFHLDRILNFRRAPLVVGRKVNLRQEVLPVSTPRLTATFKEKNSSTCFYGQCFYCKETELACGKGEVMEGCVTLWIPDSWPLIKVKHPYQRTYREDKKARWEMDDNYCDTYVKRSPPYDKGPRLLDLLDTAIFDFIIGNADRHHYEILGDQQDAMMLLLDNAKSFGNPDHDEMSILAPIQQCCMLRKSTFERLTELKGGLLTRMLIEATRTDPIAPILHKKHIEAINRRMPLIFATLQKCVSQYGLDVVIVDNWGGLPRDP